MKAALRLVAPGAMPASERGAWAGVATHSHMLRCRELDFEGAKRNLVEWARSRRVAAVGVGSPWDPVSGAHYGQYETVDRDRYFSGQVAPESVMDRPAVEGLIAELNARSAGATLFYLDNETPKNRYGHLWYVGFEYQVPAWHDYAQDRRAQFCEMDPVEDLNRMTGRPHRRRTYLEVVARQRRAGALGIWAHPTSWWRHDKAFVTNIAAELITHLHADGFLDGMVVQGYDACHRAYQALWFDLLDRGACVPGFAELDACFDKMAIAETGCFLNQVPSRESLPTVAGLLREMRAGRHFVSSGPHLVLSVDGQPMGSHLASGAGQGHRAVVEAWPAPGEPALSRVELVGPGGKVLAFVTDFTGGKISFDVTGSAGGGYVLARAFGAYDASSEPRQQAIRHCALTNPVYLDTALTPRIAPVETRLALTVDPSGPAWRAPFRVLTAAGEPLETGVLCEKRLDLRVPAHARLELSPPGGEIRDISVAMANAPLRAHIDYLADGQFLKDWPECACGDVPVEAFRFESVRAALGEVTLSLRAVSGFCPL